MRKELATVLVALGFVLSAFLTSSAMAGSFGFGLVGSGAHFSTSGTETETTGDLETNSAKENNNLFYGSVFAEYTLGEMYGMTLGVSYTPVDSSIGAKSRTDSQTASDALDSSASNDSGKYTAEAEISGHATVYIEPTFMPNDNFGLYLKGGVSRVTVNSLETIALGEDSSAYGNETVLGGMFGLGAKVVHDSGLMFKLEYTKTIYETVKMTSTTGNKNIISADPEIEAFRLAIGYQF